MSEKLTRKELLDLLGNPPGKDHLLDDLDKKALDGYQYLDTNQSAETALKNLDSRFDKWLDKKEVVKEKKVKTRLIYVVQRAAAIILILLIPAIFLLSPDNATKLADRYFEAPRSSYLILNRGEQTSESNAITKAFALYEKGNFAKASPAIQDLINQNPDKKDLKFYQAISLYSLGKIDESISILEICADDDYQDLNRRSPWYLGLAYLKKGDIDQAKIWLNKVTEIDSIHRQDAQKILQKL